MRYTQNVYSFLSGMHKAIYVIHIALYAQINRRVFSMRMCLNFRRLHIAFIRAHTHEHTHSQTHTKRIVPWVTVIDTKHSALCAKCTQNLAKVPSSPPSRTTTTATTISIAGANGKSRMENAVDIYNNNYRPENIRRLQIHRHEHATDKHTNTGQIDFRFLAVVERSYVCGRHIVWHPFDGYTRRKRIKWIVNFW